jgi:hypothetical protein
MTPLQALRRGRERLAIPGAWIRGSLVDIFQGMIYGQCALGSLCDWDWRNEKVVISNLDAVDYLCRAIGKILPREERSSAIAAYNDAPHRTLEEVLAMFDRAIELAQHDEEAEIAAEIDTISVDELIEVLSPV